MCVEIVHARAEHLRELLMQQGWQAKTIDLLCRGGPPSFPVELGPESHRMQIHVLGFCTCGACLEEP